ncbi:hypothetical protein SAMN02983003_2962 [Devosia enhydra]|uniref:DUF1178 family protein n=1 Tax=Devosia enhydra TaxID=665118 RepID=A0A1K2I0D7_9HYPH|nr:DUF1178 family protein [Devosia enhydra]SFZ85792.1 hypothetical protein SAMN02983003_2962 [Devosia enhydra]
MITYTLSCAAGHRFDGWFRSADAFEDQRVKGVLTCPDCGSASVDKAIMAPSVARRDTGRMPVSAGHPDQATILAAMRALKRKLMSEAENVGDRFAEEARKIHFEEADPRGIYGQATPDEARALAEEGIPFMPLPDLPEEQN